MATVPFSFDNNEFTVPNSDLLRLGTLQFFKQLFVMCPMINADTVNEPVFTHFMTSATSAQRDVGGFEVIDEIKAEVDKICGWPVVSCADILAVAARDSVVALGGPSWKVLLGRRDSTTASRTQADTDLPAPFMDLPALINNFKNQGLNERDLVALSGGHTIGFAQCFTFRNRIYNATNIDPVFAENRRATCPRTGGDTNLTPLDPSPARFDNAYFNNLVKQRGLLISDQALFRVAPLTISSILTDCTLTCFGMILQSP
ncbi:Peroxidase 2 [Hibiscus syriacus]|uniref:peroxidase n=1 Tax=Hibiscus syriacus TaxID=106335 RepID=A0A6A3BMW1_HIBSY|nr:Peroxidase 2 [Hibiscus syriacus]